MHLLELNRTALPLMQPSWLREKACDPSPEPHNFWGAGKVDKIIRCSESYGARERHYSL